MIFHYNDQLQYFTSAAFTNLPVRPTMATFSPGLIDKETLSITGSYGLAKISNGVRWRSFVAHTDNML